MVTLWPGNTVGRACVCLDSGQ